MPVVISPDGQIVASHSSSYSQTIKLWQLHTGDLIGTLTCDALAGKVLCLQPRWPNPCQ